MSVHKKLMEARIKLHAMSIKKSGRNTFANYDYMELGDFLIPAQQIFAELGLCGIVSFTADLATLTITDIESGKELVISSPMGSAALKGCHEVQNIGAVETYQRRYLWVAALEIVEHDAIDGSEGAGPKADVAAILKGITGSASLDVLKSNFEAAMQMLGKQHHDAITKAKNARYRELAPKKETA